MYYWVSTLGLDPSSLKFSIIQLLLAIFSFKMKRKYSPAFVLFFVLLCFVFYCFLFQEISRKHHYYYQETLSLFFYLILFFYECDSIRSISNDFLKTMRDKHDIDFVFHPFGNQDDQLITYLLLCMKYYLLLCKFVMILVIE